MATKELEQRRADERARYVEMQAALRRRHFQVKAEEEAIRRYYQHDALAKLQRLREQAVQLPGLAPWPASRA
jgi:hypothetical protein